ncbi:polysaccharide deacetylase [Bacillus sp. FJAT-42376]|uniref:polysaccharide deacetylase family protein n=1 Tax=Bacillus sp. FJAT-42376 TaxID=2014076 RepID=UPI000F4DEAD3|nr:polysaccharide deacetylase family protein [Bacillus sp. FJAT-42376]AZB42149.1 polysaccharide deacetylase [Bacillus sp. FJAT-42376]
MEKRQPTPKYLWMKAGILGVMGLVLASLWIGPDLHSPVKAKVKSEQIGMLRTEGEKELMKENPPKTMIPETPKPKPKQTMKRKTVYLTFDDGPSPATEDLLDALDKYDVPATFFMLEPNMRKHEKEVKRLVEKGHAAGLHGVSHKPKVFYATPDSVVGEMTAARDTLKNITGISTELVRTPYGSVPNLTEPEQLALQSANFQYWDWNVDSFDWKYKKPEYVEDVLKQVEKRNQDFPDQPIIILMHDRIPSPEALNQLIPELKKRGYSFDALSENMEPVHLK